MRSYRFPVDGTITLNIYHNDICAILSLYFFKGNTPDSSLLLFYSSTHTSRISATYMR